MDKLVTARAWMGLLFKIVRWACSASPGVGGVSVMSVVVLLFLSVS